MKNEMKKNNQLATKPVEKSTPETDPISVTKHALDMARADFKRIREVGILNKGVGKETDPKIAEMREELSNLKVSRTAAMEAVKKAKADLISTRNVVKALTPRKKFLRTELKKFSKTHTKSAALDEARVAVLEAELAYRKACMG